MGSDRNRVPPVKRLRYWGHLASGVRRDILLLA